jgi:TolB-like protein/class 3 adenylate cyclase
MASTRRLTAILAADVAGYSRLMGVDEEGTHERLKAHLRELIDPKIEEHRGHIVKNTGDGMLAEFASVVDAVRCAAQVQRGMIDREPEVPNERQIKFRIGVNLGDVIADGGDIFGDGVNVAARLEALAEPGGICVSRVVRDQVRDKLPYSFEDRGEQNVKNIARPVRVYALLPEAVAELPVAGVPIAVPRHRPSAIAAMAVAATAVLVIAVIAWWVWPTMRSSPTPPAAVSAAATSIAQPLVAPRLSIIVLPFTNLSNDPEQQYFADAVTEDLTTDLSRIGHMFVISRNTAFTYRNKPVDGKQIGRDLGVRYVLEGSVQRSGNQVRVNAQLINAETDAHLWAERFDRDIGDLFALQSEITGRIAKALGVALITREAARPTEHPDALDYILRGSAAGLKPNSRDVSAEAISLFEHALTLNPRSVEAQTLLANSLVGRVRDQMTDSAAADLARAEGLVDQALAAASRNAFAHLVKGRVLQAQNRWEEAVLEFEATLGSDSNSVWALHYLAMSKLFTGSIEEVIPLEEQAIRLSPREPRIGWWYYAIGTVHLLQSRTDEAIVWLEKARSAIPAAPVFRSHLASAYALRSETERAAAELAEARRLVGDDRYSSIAHLQAVGYFGVPKIRVLFEATYFAGLRKAGMPEE